MDQKMNYFISLELYFVSFILFISFIPLLELRWIKGPKNELFLFPWNFILFPLFPFISLEQVPVRLSA